MLWREGYTTRIERELDLPMLAGQLLSGELWAWPARCAVAGSFRVREFQTREVWRRLFVAELPIPFVEGVVLASPSPSERATWGSMVPASRHPVSALLIDPDLAWARFVGDEAPNLGFGLLVKEGRPDLMMIGPPTEEAWEEFLDLSRR